MDALAASAAGKGREDLLWTAPYGGYLRPPAANPAHRRGGPLPGGRWDLPPGDCSRATACSGLVGHLGGLESQGGAADAPACQRATPLDVHADLFECDLDAVAESVSKCVDGGPERTPAW